MVVCEFMWQNNLIRMKHLLTEWVSENTYSCSCYKTKWNYWAVGSLLILTPQSQTFSEIHWSGSFILKQSWRSTLPSSVYVFCSADGWRMFLTFFLLLLLMCVICCSQSTLHLYWSCFRSVVSTNIKFCITFSFLSCLIVQYMISNKCIPYIHTKIMTFCPTHILMSSSSSFYSSDIEFHIKINYKNNFVLCATKQDK